MSLRCSYLNWAHCPLLRSELSLWERVLWIYGMWVSMIQLQVPQMLYIHGGLLTSGASQRQRAVALVCRPIDQMLTC